MRLVICGAGIIGSNLAHYLSEQGHEVNVIEQKQAVAHKISEKLDVRVIVGTASDPAVLEEAGVAEADMVVAVTNSDLSNLSICSLAAAYGAKKRIARVRDRALNEVLKKFGPDHFYVDDIINPDEVASQAIIKVITAPGSRQVADFADGKILLRAFDVPEDSPLSGIKLGELAERDFPWPFLVVAIRRNSEVVIPYGEDVINPKDRIYVLLPKHSTPEFVTFLDPGAKLPKKVIIYGATATGISLAQGLSERIPEVVLLEESRVKAERVAGLLDDVRVTTGSASEADILRECGVEAADTFIAVSSNDQSNLISAVLAKKLGAGTTVITTFSQDYMAITGAMNIDVVINPRLLAIDQILRLVRGSQVTTVATIPECGAEVIELIPEKDSPITKKPIRDINFPKNSIVGAIYRGNEVILASGSTEIKEGEPVVVFCIEDVMHKLEKLFVKKGSL